MTTQTDFDKLRQPSEAPGYRTPLDKPSDSTLDHGNSRTSEPLLSPKPDLTPLGLKLQPDLTQHSYKIDHKDSIKRIQKELEGSLRTTPLTKKYQKATIKEEPLNFLESLYLIIHEISIVAF